MRTEHIKSVRTSFHGNCRGIGRGAQWTERVRSSAEGNKAFRRANKRVCREAMALQPSERAFAFARAGARKRTDACMGKKKIKKLKINVDRIGKVCYTVDTVKKEKKGEKQ